MNACFGIRLEDKNEWERRTPLIPAHVKELREKHGLEVYVQSSPIRAFGHQEYEQAGARIVEDLTACPLILAIKEIPPQLFEKDKTYVFFSHTIKGQAFNMPMLQRLLDLGCQLIDYEKIVDERGRRQVFFGNYAGLAGMIDTLWALGQRLAWEKIDTPFSHLRPARERPGDKSPVTDCPHR
jgi:saccharopine dehydrogenase (NAD+, L-lysine-forming)